MNKHDRYNRSEKGRARHSAYNLSDKGRARMKVYNAKRVRVMGEQVQAPDMETRELMRQLRDDRKAAHG